MAVRLFFWTVVFDIILRLQGSYAEETCDPGKNILITNVQNWEDVLKHEDVQKLISQLETDESVSRIHFNFNIVEAEENSHDREDQEPTPTPMSTTPEHTGATTFTVPPSPTTATREESTASRTRSTKPQPTTTNAQGTLCEKGWYNASDGHCYKLFESISTFGAASENCRKLLNNSATLAIGIRNLTIKSEIVRALKLNQSNSGRVIWIGLRQELKKSRGKWFWTDRTEMTNGTTKGWKSGEPSNGVKEDCAALDTNHDFNFGDFDCSWSGYYICESAQSYNRTAIGSWWEFVNG